MPDLIEMMVGAKVNLQIKRETYAASEKLLEIKNLTVKGNEGGLSLDGVTFTLNENEILGIAGIAGSGQKELCEAIAGLVKAESGSIVFEDTQILGKGASEIIKLGIRLGFIPEDRLGMGLVASMNLIDNVILKDYRLQKGMMLSRKPGVDKATRIVKRLDIATPGIGTSVGKLSGGNIQKVLLGREIDSSPKVLVTAYPVRGLDIGATFKIYDLLNEQKSKGVGIIFVGEDLDVLLELCDRILVLSSGKVNGILDAKSATKSELGYLMAGTSLQELESELAI
jgi:simple sugar transport system ATP-binding protein